MNKRINPHRVPATQADVSKARKQGQNEGLTIAWAIFFRTMRDKEGYGTTRLKRLWAECEELADAITNDEVRAQDIIDSLRDEDGITLNSAE